MRRGPVGRGTGGVRTSAQVRWLITGTLRMRPDSRASQSNDRAREIKFERGAINRCTGFEENCGLDLTDESSSRRFLRKDIWRYLTSIAFHHAGTIQSQGSASTPFSSGRAWPPCSTTPRTSDDLRFKSSRNERMPVESLPVT